MQRRKSKRHVYAANARWRGRSDRADAERQAGIPDRPSWPDERSSIDLDLSSYGGRRLRIEPRIGYIAVRVIDEDTLEVIDCAAIKTALHRIADSLARTMGARSRC